MMYRKLTHTFLTFHFILFFLFLHDFIFFFFKDRTVKRKRKYCNFDTFLLALLRTKYFIFTVRRTTALKRNNAHLQYLFFI